MTPPLPDLDALLREQEWLRRLARRLLGDGPDADDLAQETLTRAIRRAGRSRDNGSAAASGRPSVRGWLRTIAHNLRLERGREEARRRVRERGAARPEASGAPVDTEAIDRALLRRSLIDEVLRLPEPERSPLILHYFEGLSHGEIAARLGIPSGASRKRVSRAMGRLREAMGKRSDGIASLGLLLLPIGMLRLSAPLPTAALGSGSAYPLPAAVFMTLQAKACILLLAASVAALLVWPALAPQGRRVSSDAEELAHPMEVRAESNDSRDLGGAAGATRGSDRRSPGDLGPVAPKPITHAVYGRVVDMRRMPAPGVSVDIDWANAPAGSRGAAGETDGDGRFRVGASWGDRPASASSGLLKVSAIARGGGKLSGAAFQESSAPKEGRVVEVDMGTLVLVDSHELTVSVDGPPASVRVFITHDRLPWGTFQTDLAGQVTIADLPRGVVTVIAATEVGQARGLAFVPEDTVLELRPEATGSIDVTLIDGDSGAPVPGARLGVVERYLSPATLPSSPFIGQRHEQRGDVPRLELATFTDRRGMARIDGLARGVYFELEAEAEGYRGLRASAKFTSESGTLVAEMAPHNARTVRWRILPGERPVPGDGIALECSHAPCDLEDGKPVPTVRIEGGELVAEGVVGYANLMLRAPDGSIASAYAMGSETVGEELSFLRPRRVRLCLTNPAGVPIEGVCVRAVDQREDQVGASPPSGPDGIAIVHGLLDGLVDLYASPLPGSVYSPSALGAVKIDRDDVEIAATLEPTRAGRFRLRLSAGGSQMLPYQFLAHAEVPLRVLEEHPGRGELVLEVQDAKLHEEIEATFQSKGFALERFFVRFDRPDQIPEYDLVLRPTANLVVKVTPMQGERADVMAEQYRPESGRWESGLVAHFMSSSNGPGGTYVFPWITPGTWRLRELNTEKTSRSIEVLAGETQVYAELDLSTGAWVTGIVEVPNPRDLGRVRVLVDDGQGGLAMGNRSAFYPRGGVSLKGNAFRILVPGDREVTLLPWHPWLSPAGAGGVARLAGGKDGVLLRLEQGHGVSIPVPQLASRMGGAVRVGRYAAGSGMMGPGSAAPLGWHHGPVVAGRVRAALPEGTWDLLIDPGPPLAPLRIPSVRVSGEVELAPAAFTEGSAIVLGLKVVRGTSAPRLYVHVTGLNGPLLERSINSDGESTIRVPGLCAGRYSVTLRAITGEGLKRTFEIAVDGEHVTEIPVNLR